MDYKMFKTKAEQRKEIIGRIAKLRKRKATYQEISDDFNKNNYKTISESFWTPQSLHRFYKTHKGK